MKHIKINLKTAARVRPRELQKLGAEFYELEHNKPLFNKKQLANSPPSVLSN